ncbi:MAG: hypothetical protein ACK4GR_05845 [bacterium]
MSNLETKVKQIKSNIKISIGYRIWYYLEYLVRVIYYGTRVVFKTVFLKMLKKI